MFQIPIFSLNMPLVDKFGQPVASLFITSRMHDTCEKFKDVLVVMVTVTQIAYNLVANFLFIQT